MIRLNNLHSLIILSLLLGFLPCAVALAGYPGWKDVPSRLKQGPGAYLKGDMLFVTGAAQALPGERSDKTHEIARKKSLLRALQMVHFSSSCEELKEKLSSEEWGEFIHHFASLAPAINNIQGLTVIRQWESGRNHYTATAVPVDAIAHISCVFPSVSSAISSYLENGQITEEGLAFCMRHTSRYSAVRRKVETMTGRYFHKRGASVLALPFTVEHQTKRNPKYDNSLIFQNHLARADKLTQAAMKMVDKGNWKDALKSISDALDLAPGYSRAYLVIADYLLNEFKRPEFALYAVQKAFRDGVMFQEALDLIVRCLHEMGSPEEEVFRHLLAQSRMAETEMYPDKWQAEVDRLDDSGVLMPSLVIMSAGLAVEGTLMPPGDDFNRAVKLFSEAKTDDDISNVLALLLGACDKRPATPKIHNLIGVCYRHLGKPEVALPFLWQALKLKPEYDFALTNLGLCCQSLGLMEAARYYFEYDSVKNSTNAWVQESYAEFMEENEAK